MENKKSFIVNGGYPLHSFQALKEVYEGYISEARDLQNIELAYNFMMEKHKGQLRKSGEPYYHHLLEVAYIVAELQSGPATICAALLHDVIEDTDTKISEIEKLFGTDVAKLVDALTKIQALKLSKMQHEEFEAEDHRKILLGMARDIRVIIIKLADRLHNMRTLGALPNERQITLSKETLEVYVPIASRLGLDVLKSELADLCLKYAYPDIYTHIIKLLNKKTKILKKSLDAIKKRIADALFEKHIEFDISARVKSISSIYHKMYVTGHKFEEIFDILALRIIVNSESECYEVLGLVHHMYTPVPGRVKDYIASPKSNMYQSLHTTIMSGDGNFYEVQIRTKEMDNIANGGVAAHWAYKEGRGYDPNSEQKEIEDKLHWFRDFVSISTENQNNSADEYMNNLTHDIFEANIYVFTPKGKVIELPKGSTPIDFAYRIHTRVGDTCVGATINTQIVPLNTILRSGDMVDIKTNKNAKPSEDWLEFVVSSQAKTHIKRYIAKKNAELLREDKINRGKQLCIDGFTERKVSEEQMLSYLSNESLLAYYNADSLDELYIQISNRNPTISAVLDYLRIKKPVDLPSNDNKKTILPNASSGEFPVYCEGIDKIAISLAACCSPIPGDPIVGYVSKGKGIMVHRKDCPNIVKQKERLVDVFWRDNLPNNITYPVDLQIETINRNGVLVDILQVLSANKFNVNSCHATTIHKGNVLIALNVTTPNVKRLEDIMGTIRSVEDVIRVSRVTH